MRMTLTKHLNAINNNMSDKKHKVLIIVGGGIYGCIPAHFLGSLPDNLQYLHGVDCISGCSIGGILAGAYAIGHRFSYIDKVFQENADNCFKRTLCARLNPLSCPTYSNEGLKGMLNTIFESDRMSVVNYHYPSLKLFIPTLNITDDKYKVFDNISSDDASVKLATIALMTSAAPSYFEGVKFRGKCYIDGGLIEVAPLMTAVTALKAKCGWEFKDMDVLMIGTGKDISDKPLTAKDYNGLTILGMATDVIVPYATLANEMATTYWGNCMGFNSFEFFNPCKHNGKLDDTDQIPDMIKQCDKYLEEFHAVYTDWLSR